MTAESNRGTSHLPTEFQAESLKLVSSLVHASAYRFFVIDPHMNIKGLVCDNIDVDIETAYHKHFWHLDPMHPRHFKNSAKTVICSNKLVPRSQWLQSIFYQDFIRPMDVMYDTDIFFRREGEIIAVFTLLRSEDDGEFSDAELELLEKIQPYMEYTLNTVYLPARFAERRSIEEKYALTQRELDVLEYLMTGANNKAIAQHLGMSLPTVRTHLQHIFEKVGVHSGNELIANLYRELGYSLDVSQNSP
ncbi:response regulator transcription factor [Pseudomaricurvus alcaniphilus]|uniref:response regulator transcription factor n=1 Tax=Pseudomaricurvus alcaniphilus TaxID=1166482 RepID=UPI00140B1531|nr:LuxR C-terminal-related transcriptional regulator [Pseudomaricurvus alcaniphilus]NHN38030.1 response regulator transcription factor [Pseudomaricurvus alcaniphilus]